VTGFEVDAGTKTVSLRFTAEAGKTYALRRVRNLGGSEGEGAGEWNTVKRVTATESGELSVLVDDGDFDSLSRAFYCLEEQQ
jgi:hypothetical protein